LKAIDGIYLPSELALGEEDSLFATKSELSPWLQIDLTINHFVKGVKISDRSESTEGESVNYFVRLLYNIDVLSVGIYKFIQGNLFVFNSKNIYTYMFAILITCAI